MPDLRPTTTPEYPHPVPPPYRRGKYVPPPATAITDDGADAPAAGGGATPTLLQPRVAVVLGVPDGFHPLLFGCRLLSVLPAIWFSLPIALRFLVQLHGDLTARPLSGGKPDGSSCSCGRLGAGIVETRLRLTETTLAMIWCGASAYLSFFFTDCLMSRWLLNYTPSATIVRLLAINALNGYLTSCVLFLTGASADSRMLLPAWIAIATILTSLYHITQRKINIRKETSISISVFSGASFISMVSLLALHHSSRVGHPTVPIILMARKAWVETMKVVYGLLDAKHSGGEL